MSTEQEQSPQAIWDELEQQESGQAPAPAAAEPADPAAKPVGETPTATAVPAEAGASTETDQPTETLSAEQSALDKRLEELTHLVKSTAGRVGALQSELTKLGQSAARAVDDAPTQGQIAKAAGDPAKWARMKEDFPDWAEAVESYVGTIAKPKAGDSDAVVELRKEIEALHKQSYEDARDIVSDADSAWEEKVRSDWFKSWLSSKPEEERQRIASSTRPAVVLKAIREAEAAKKAAEERAAKNKSRVAAAAMPSGNAPTPRKNPDDMTEKELWAYLDAQEAQGR